MAKHDVTFVREGRPLSEWLSEVVSPEPKVRAGDAVAAMFYALPSVHTDSDDIEGEGPDSQAHSNAWRRAVREAVERPDFPRRPFFIAAAANVVGRLVSADVRLRPPVLLELSLVRDTDDERESRTVWAPVPSGQEDAAVEFAAAIAAKRERAG